MLGAMGLVPLALALLIASPAAHTKKKPAVIAEAAIAVRLKSGAGIDVQNEERAYGLEKTVRLLTHAIGEVRRRFALTPDLIVGDLSFRGGGRMRPHRSHRRGLDADVGYYFKDGRPRHWFIAPKPKELDIPRQWALFEALMRTGQVEYLFVSYPLQAALHAYARKHGWSEKRLHNVFQWPRHRRQKVGIIRYEHGHHDHFHVRFTADP